jgi:hypothetical protein
VGQRAPTKLAKADRTMEHGTRVSVLEVEGTLRAPMNRELSHRVETLLCRGERRVVLDLVRLTDIDAAGVGELVGAFIVARNFRHRALSEGPALWPSSRAMPVASSVAVPLY